MAIRLGMVMDPIAGIDYQDTTLAMLWEAQERGWELYYFEIADLFLRDNQACGHAQLLKVYHDENKWFEFTGKKTIPLADLQVILMRKDPPLDDEYLYATYILEYAEQQGVLVMNKPQSLRDCNEKLSTLQFPHCVPPTLVTQCKEELRAFWREQGDIVCKPLNAFAGISIFRLKKEDVNANVVFEVLTAKAPFYIIAQQYIPEITQGDKRILLINGEPVSHMMVRIPQGNDWRGNLCTGASCVVQPIGEKERLISAHVGPILRDRGLYFVGLDIIGDYLTEINVTSPGGIRVIDAAANINIRKQFFDFIATKLK